MPPHDPGHGAPTVAPDLRAALDAANIPTLLLVLAHLTGERRWLEEPYKPTRTVALDDNDTAGLPEPRRREVRDAVAAVAREIAEGTRPLPAAPSGDRIVELLSMSLGEPVPPEYAESMAEDGGFDAPAWQRGRPLDSTRPRVLVVGAGFSGVCMGIALRHLGLPFTIVERNAAVGGTWLENAYPGAGVDTPGHLYSYSFAPRADWTRHYPKQPEILAYLQEVARDAGLTPAIRFGTEVNSATWDEQARAWHVTTRTADGTEEQHVAEVLVSAVGLFNTPSVPHLPGLESFPGPVLHTARWDNGVDLAGARVGVVGTGASAMQVVPAIAGQARQVVVFQRSPQWVAPNPNYLRTVDDDVRLLMEHLPTYRTWYRLRLLWMFNDKLQPTLRKDPDWPHPDRSLNAANDRHRQFFTDHLDAQLDGHPRLRAALLPDYPPYGKRILMDNDWFATLRRDDVELVAAGVEAVEGATVRTTDGGHHDVDVLVLATGFTARRMLHPMDVRGRSGVSLRERWGDDDARAHLGITVPGFPNLFLLYGPNTNTGHGGSLVFLAECQTRYITAVLRLMVERRVAALDVRPEVHDAYNARVDAAHEQMIWTHPGMSTYYRNSAGRVVTNLPWRLVDYWAYTRAPDLTDFSVS